MPRATILAIVITIILSGYVGKYFSSDSIFAPVPVGMGGVKMKQGSPEYMKGWNDGCETGLSTMVSGYYKTFYGFKQDPYMIGNLTYFKTWNDAYTYCRQYSFRYSWDPWDRTYNKVLEQPLCLICPNEVDRQQ